MKIQRSLLFSTVIIIFSWGLLGSCDTLGLGSGGEGDGGDGALDPINLSGDEDGDNGELDQLDLSSTCPDIPSYYELTFDYLLEYNDQNGFVRERSDPTASISVVVQGDLATNRYSGTESETIPGIIEGQIGDCQVDGMFEFSFIIVGDCTDGIVTLDITGTYEIYQRKIVCNGQVAENFTDSLVDGPGALVTFNLSTSGDTFPTSLDLGIAKIEYTWTLSPTVGANPLTQ